MLTKGLLRYRIDNGRISPALLDPGSPRYSQAARDLIAIFGESIGKTLGELEEAIEKYAARKIAKVRAARLDNLILAVSKRLALGEETAKELDVLWFAGRLPAADVIERADLLAG
jgi:predicted nuclease of restriction endonuclease-like RecB superfamily